MLEKGGAAVCLARAAAAVVVFEVVVDVSCLSLSFLRRMVGAFCQSSSPSDIQSVSSIVTAATVGVEASSPLGPGTSVVTLLSSIEEDEEDEEEDEAAAGSTVDEVQAGTCTGKGGASGMGDRLLRGE